MTRWWPVIVAVLVAWSAFVLLARWFGVVYREQTAREGQLDRREASLEVWSAELEQVDADRVARYGQIGVEIESRRNSCRTVNSPETTS